MTSSYTDEQRKNAIVVLLTARGNIRIAHERLKAAGTPVPIATLKDWKVSPEYEALNAQRDELVIEQMADQAENLAAMYGEIEARMGRAVLKRSPDELAELTPASLLAAARSAAIGRGISTDKAADLRGRPKRPESQIDPIEALQKLQRLGVVQVNPALIAGEAKELEPGE